MCPWQETKTEHSAFFHSRTHWTLMSFSKVNVCLFTIKHIKQSCSWQINYYSASLRDLLFHRKWMISVIGHIVRRKTKEDESWFFKRRQKGQHYRSGSLWIFILSTAKCWHTPFLCMFLKFATDLAQFKPVTNNPMAKQTISWLSWHPKGWSRNPEN